MFKFTPVTDWKSLTDAPDILTVQEVARFLRVSPQSVRDYIDRGAIPAFQLKDAAGNLLKRKYIPKTSLLKYVEGMNE